MIDEHHTANQRLPLAHAAASCARSISAPESGAFDSQGGSGGSLTLRASHQRSYDALVRNTSSSDRIEAVIVKGVRPTLITYAFCGAEADGEGT